MAISKVIYDNNVLVDLTADTITSDKMLTNTTAHRADGVQITGNISNKSSTDLTVSGATVTVPSGYYSAQATKSVATGTAGTPSANKGAVSNHQITITPTVTNTTGYITGGTKNGTAVTVSASDLVSGSETVDKNGTYDVTNLAQLVVAVAGLGAGGNYNANSNDNGDGTQTIIITDAEGGGGGLPNGIKAIAFGEITINSAFTTSPQTFSHDLGEVPDFMMVYAPSNVATTYSMLGATRGSIFNWRSGYNCNYAYHGNSTTTVTWGNSNSATYGISNMTASTFGLASNSASYYWRAGTYKYIAIKFD